MFLNFYVSQITKYRKISKIENNNKYKYRKNATSGGKIIYFQSNGIIMPNYKFMEGERLSYNKHKLNFWDKLKDKLIKRIKYI